MPPNEEAISALEQAFMDYVQRQDALALSSTVFSDDAELMPPNRPSVIGRERIAAFWQEMFGRGLNKILLNTTCVDISDELAQARGQYAFTFSHNGEVSHDKGKYLLTYRRQGDGEWKVVTDMYSSDMPVA